MQKCIWFTAFLILLVNTIFAAGDRGYSLNLEEESWIEKVDFDRDLVVEDKVIKAGVYYLLLDRQILLTENGKKEYIHSVVKVEKESGLESYSQLDFSFQPSYQTLTVHRVTIYRGDKKIEQLDFDDLKIIEENGSQEYLIYEETRTINILLKDVRVGDTIEYSFTRSGSNPIFENNYFDTLYLNWSFPLEKLNYRVLVPRNRELFTRSFSTEIKPDVIDRADGYREYRVTGEKREGVNLESNSPAWFEPYSRIQFTEFKDWSEINRLFLKHYRVSSESKVALDREFKLIVNSTGDKEYAIKELIKFVRTEIRYLGIEIGIGSHKPSLPEEVLERRYGDCKDKAMLLVAFLEKLGIEAYPVLVNSAKGFDLDSYLPSPSLFNHVIVRATINGNYFWIDPTLTYERGLPDYSYHYDYGFSLILKEQSGQLTKMPEERLDEPGKMIEEVFDLRAGVARPGKMYVKTTHRGEAAYSLREELAYYTKGEIQDNYLSYYTDFYPLITTEKSFTVSDYEDTNRIVTEEYYVIDKIWDFDKKEGYHTVNFYPHDLIYYITKPDKSELANRKAPYQLEHPVNIRYSTKVLLSDRNWSFKRRSKEFDGEYFFFFHKFTYDSSETTLYIVYEIRSKKSYLRAAEIEDYNKELENIMGSLGYNIYDRGSHKSKVELIIFIIFALLTALVVGGLIVIDRFKNREKYAMKANLKTAHKSRSHHHKCLVCGRTDGTDPHLSFRYCDDCSVESCYCIDHINEHDHI